MGVDQDSGASVGEGYFAVIWGRCFQRLDVVKDPQRNDSFVRRTVPNDAVEMAR